MSPHTPQPARARRVKRATLLLGAVLCTVLKAQTAAPVDPNDTSAYKNMSLTELMTLDVTSVSKEAQPYSEAPAAIDVVTSDDIRRSGATSIPEALELAGNLEVAQKNPHDWAISARGFNTELSNKLLVLMDGRSVYTPLFSGVFWDVQDYLLQDIDRIEVISGPGGTLWGANAVNGVINITTKSAHDTLGGYLEVGGGDELNSFEGARYGFSLGNGTDVRVYAKYFDSADQVTKSGQDAQNGASMAQAGFRLDSTAVQGSTFTLQGDAYTGHEGIVGSGISDSDGNNVLGRWTRAFDGGSNLILQAYADRTHLTDPIGSAFGAKAGFLDDNLYTYDIDLQYDVSAGSRQKIVCGTGYRYTHEVDINAPSLAFLPPTLNQDLYSAFVQDEITIAQPLILTLGSKVEHNDYTGYEEEPSARIKWDMATHQMLWAAVSRAVRTPSRVDVDEAEPNPPPKVLVGNPDFESETLLAYELGYRAQFTQDISGSISTFYNQYNDVRSLGYTPATILPLIFQNNLHGETHGAELSGAWQLLSWWRLQGSYDLLREHITVKLGTSDLNNALNETADPGHQSSLRSSMDLPGRIQLDAQMRWVEAFTINNGGVAATAPGYSELNARIAWAATNHLELSLVGQNLLHRLHVEYGVPGPGQEEIERSYYAKAAWRF